MNEEGMNEDVQIAEPTTSPSQETPVQEEVSTFRLVATLAVAGTLAGLLIVLVNKVRSNMLYLYPFLHALLLDKMIQWIAAY